MRGKYSLRWWVTWSTNYLLQLFNDEERIEHPSSNQRNNIIYGRNIHQINLGKIISNICWLMFLSFRFVRWTIIWFQSWLSWLVVGHSQALWLQLKITFHSAQNFTKIVDWARQGWRQIIDWNNWEGPCQLIQKCKGTGCELLWTGVVETCLET